MNLFQNNHLVSAWIVFAAFFAQDHSLTWNSFGALALALGIAIFGEGPPRGKVLVMAGVAVAGVYFLLGPVALPTRAQTSGCSTCSTKGGCACSGASGCGSSGCGAGQKRSAAAPASPARAVRPPGNQPLPNPQARGQVIPLNRPLPVASPQQVNPVRNLPSPSATTSASPALTPAATQPQQSLPAKP